MSSAEVTWPLPPRTLFGECLSAYEVEVNFPPLWIGVPAVAEPGLRPSLAEKFLRLVALESNWDGHGALRPRPDSLQVVAEFLAALPSEMPDPDVLASTTGGVLLEWEQDDVELLLTVSGAAFSSAVVAVDDSEVEGPIDSVRDEVLEALSKLMSRA